MSVPSVLPVSVVIPSLARSSLTECLTALYSGSSIPSETIICLPPGVSYEPPPSCTTIRVTNCPRSGQVYQRQHGLLEVASSYVLQLDDDILIQHDALRNLFRAAAFSPSRSAFGPVFYEADTGFSWHSMPNGLIGLLENLYQTLFHFLPWGIRRMGRVSQSSFCWGVQHDGSNIYPTPVDWLAGGCILYSKDLIVTDAPNFFSGKAYSEDLFYSYLRRRIDVSHYVVPGASVFTPRDHRSLNFFHIVSEYRTRFFVAKSMNCSTILFTYGFAADLVRSLFARLLFLTRRIAECLSRRLLDLLGSIS